jgi:hypothetical protein
MVEWGGVEGSGGGYLWIKERLLNVLIVTTHSHFSCENNKINISIEVWMYNPFELNANNSRGIIYKFEYGHAHSIWE